MELVRVLLLSTYLFIQANCMPHPGSGHHHVHHRIHVPAKIRTIYRTKVIKVPEHHHYFHEKEKIIHVEKHKEEPVYPPLKEEDIGEFSDHYFGESEHHTVHKKHAPASTVTTTTKKSKHHHHPPTRKYKVWKHKRSEPEEK